MPAYNCPMCGMHLEKLGRLEIQFAQHVFDREGLTLVCHRCSCVIEVHPQTGMLAEFPGMKLDHLRNTWPGITYLDHQYFSPKVSWLTNGES